MNSVNATDPFRRIEEKKTSVDVARCNKHWSSQESDCLRVYLENLYAIVAWISYDDVPLIIDSHPSRKAEQSFFRTFCTERELAASVDIEHLNTVIICIADNHSIGAWHRNIGRML